ncbi:alpha/beta hydrolase [Paraburkholderia sp.]|uniref:alpha/beta hydrolase n=1 Tax=Paraburkholderia sp. TaxID=1926495 RepID=UPI0039E35030
MPLHPAISQLIEAERSIGRKRLSAGTVQEARDQVERSAQLLGQGPEVYAVSDLRVPTRDGDIDGRLLRTGETERGLIVYLHGGGWITGSIASSEALARHLATRCSCAALLLDYRLAPEHPFPAAFEDVQDALRWAGVHRARLCGSAGPLVIAGDSAGANLATAAAAELGRLLDIALQVLFYPVTDTDVDNGSYREFADGPRLGRNDMLWFLKHYAPPEMWADPRIAPLRNPRLDQSPPAWIATAEYDVLRDEGEAYARELAAAGVPVELVRFDGMVHGFARMVNFVDTAHRAIDAAAEAIRRRIAPG